MRYLNFFNENGDTNGQRCSIYELLDILTRRVLKPYHSRCYEGMGAGVRVEMRARMVTGMGAGEAGAVDMGVLVGVRA